MTSLSGGFYTEQEHVRRSETIWIGDALLHTSDTSTLPLLGSRVKMRRLLIPLRIWEGTGDNLCSEFASLFVWVHGQRCYLPSKSRCVRLSPVLQLDSASLHS